MHELVLTESIVALVESEARRHHMSSVSRIDLEIGAASAIDVDTVLYCFPIVSAGTVAESARLEIERVPIMGECRTCGHQFVMEAVFSPCPRCAGHGVTIVAGKSMRVKSLTGE